jgi:hypothetical protein
VLVLVLVLVLVPRLSCFILTGSVPCFAVSGCVWLCLAALVLCVPCVAALQGLLTCDELQSVPFLVLGNKIDVPQAASEDELRAALGLYETYGKESKGERDPNLRPIELYMCSVVRRMGYADGFRWMAQFL